MGKNKKCVIVGVNSEMITPIYEKKIVILHNSNLHVLYLIVNRMKRVAIIGTQGVPARYGGFESLVENLIGDPTEVSYTVYCSSRDNLYRQNTHKGAQLKFVPLRANGAQSVPYDMLCLLRSLVGYDVLLVLGVSGCLLLPVVRLLSRSKIVTNIDGLEHRREKWGWFAKLILRWSEYLAVRFSHVVIGDNQGIVDYVRKNYGVEAKLITYGGDQAVDEINASKQSQLDEKYRNLAEVSYDITVCRIEPENNTDKILRAYVACGQRLVVVGNWSHNEWGRRLMCEFKSQRNIVMLESVYDINELYWLRGHARCYLHGHSAGGTNPSLVEAMFFGKPILAFDVVYNRATTENKALYWSTEEDLRQLILQLDFGDVGARMREVAEKKYCWETIKRQYEELFLIDN